MVWSMGVPPAEQLLLSVVTPVLNGARHIGGTLASVRALARAGVSVEHIIMDGGSSDGTLDLVGWERDLPDSPITHVISEPDCGQADAINRGFSLASGQFLGWLNADDVYAPSAFTSFAEKLAQTSADVVLGRCEFIDDFGRSVYCPVPPDPVTPGSLLRLLSGWYAGRSIVQPEAFVTADSFKRHGELRCDLHYTMDHEYWLRLAAKGASFEQHDLVVAKQLVHPGQKTADNTKVVREQLAYANEYAESLDGSLGGDMSEVRQELRLLDEKVRVMDRLCRAIGNGYLAGASSVRQQEADDFALAHLSRVARRPERVLCAGLTPREVADVIGALRLSCAPVVAREVPRVIEKFDAVIAAPVAGFSGCWLEQVIRTTKKHGHLCVYGMPDESRITALKSGIGQELSNRLTWNRASLIAPGADEDWIARLAGPGLVGAGDAERSDSELLRAFRYGTPAHHQLLELAHKLKLECDPRVWFSGVFTRK